MKELLNNNIIPNVVLDGSRIKCMTVKKLKLRFVDSFLLTISPLKDFTNMFDLNNKNVQQYYGLDNKPYRKGDFPDLFNVEENQNYIGSMPDIKYYGIEQMKSAKTCKYDKNKIICDNKNKCCRCELIRWHQELKDNNYIFNFQEELKNYCIDDVRLLTAGCIVLRQIQGEP